MRLDHDSQALRTVTDPREFGKVAPQWGGSWAMYDVVDFGFNFRMTEMQATLGLGQLVHLPFRMKARERNLVFAHLKLELLL